PAPSPASAIQKGVNRGNSSVALADSGSGTAMSWRSHSLLFATLGEYPLHQLRFGESPFPYIVVYASVLRVEGLTSCFPSCRHSLTRHRHRHGLIGVPVEIPQ